MSLDSTPTPVRIKPAKPYPGFPLGANTSNGQWCKKIRGKIYYFGKLADPEAALAKYLSQKEALETGTTTATTEEPLTLRRLVGLFLTYKQGEADKDKLNYTTVRELKVACGKALATFGGHTLVSALKPADFARLVQAMGKTWGEVRVRNMIVNTKTIFKWAVLEGKIDYEPAYGSAFKKPSARLVQEAKNAKGPMVLTPQELLDLIHNADPALKAMILLGANFGFGNQDVGTLPLSAIDFKTGWITFARSKTAVKRRNPLWPETLEAIKEWLVVRPTPKDACNADLVFLTKYGNGWAQRPSNTPLSQAFRKLADFLGMEKPGFYWLRHTFQSIGDETLDFVAVQRLMGHKGTTISNEYRDVISDERLLRVTNHVRNWLFAVPVVAEEVA